MNREDTTELCRKLHQEILAAIESNKQLQPYSVSLSDILSNDISNFEKKLHVLMKEQENTVVETSARTERRKSTSTIEDSIRASTRERRPREEWDTSLDFIRRNSVDTYQSSSGLDYSPCGNQVTPIARKSVGNRHSNMRKTISSRSELKNLLRNHQHANFKNTNRNMYAKNDLYSTLCQLCNTHERFLVVHHTKHHPEHEVLISRPSPNMADRLRSHIDTFETEGRQISGFCFFCEKLKCMTKCNWTVHFLTHTGEKLFNCSMCNFESRRKLDHKNCKNEPINIYRANTNDGSLVGFICTECNYMQIKRERMNKHQVIQHGWDEAIEGIQYEKVTLIPDLLPVKLNFPIKFGYIAPTRRFKCYICAEMTQNADTFEQHFNQKHARSTKQYQCICGQKITNFGRNLSASAILAHFEEHNANLYQCTHCEQKFFDTTGIQEHLLNDHIDCTFKFQRIHRKPDSQEIYSEVTMTNIVCNVCNVVLKDAAFTDAFKHFEQEHPNETIVLSGNVSKKISCLAKKVSDIKTKYVAVNEFDSITFN